MSVNKNAKKLRCVIPNCYSRTKNAAKVQLFPFPTDRKLCRKWEKQAGIEYGPHKRICQLHFNDGCFETNEENLDSEGTPRNRLRLKKDAVPTIFTFGPPKTSRRLKVELSETDLDADDPDEILPDGEHDAEDDDEDFGDDSSDYSPSKKQARRTNDDSEKSSPKKKENQQPKPTRFSLMLEPGQVVVDEPEVKVKIKEDVVKRGPKKKRGRPKKSAFPVKMKSKNDLKQESRDHDYHTPKKNLSLMSRQSLLERIEELEAKVATLSKENDLYKQKDKETIWVSMNSMSAKKKPIQDKSTLWVSPQDYMDEIRQEKSYDFLSETRPKKVLKRTSENTPFRCSQCESYFSSKRNLLNHIEAVHEGKKPFVCANCDKKYSQKHSLILHIARAHGVKCSMCDDKFSSIQELKQHFSKVHDGIEPTEAEKESFKEVSDEVSNEVTELAKEMLHEQSIDTTEVVLNEVNNVPEHVVKTEESHANVINLNERTETTEIVLTQDQMETQEIIFNPETTEVVLGGETYKVIVNSEDAETTEVVVTTLDPGTIQ